MIFKTIFYVFWGVSGVIYYLIAAYEMNLVALSIIWGTWWIILNKKE